MLRHFVVTGNKKDVTGFRSTRYAVVCADIERAIALTKEKYPGFVVLSIADQGVIDKVDHL